jgi:hypothetical protein
MAGNGYRNSPYTCGNVVWKSKKLQNTESMLPSNELQ